LEQLIVRESEQFTCKKLTFADWRSLVNGQLSAGHWKCWTEVSLYRLFNSSYMFCNCQTLSKASREASLRGRSTVNTLVYKTGASAMSKGGI